MWARSRSIYAMTLTVVGLIASQCSTDTLEATESVSQIALLERELNTTFHKNDIEFNSPNGSRLKLRIASPNKELLERTLAENTISIFTLTAEEAREEALKGERSPNDLNNGNPEAGGSEEDYNSMIVTEFVEKSLAGGAIAYGVKVKPKVILSKNGNSSGRMMYTSHWWTMYSGTWPEMWKATNLTYDYVYIKFYRKFNSSDATWGSTWFESTIWGYQNSGDCDGPYMIKANVQHNSDLTGNGWKLEWYDVEDSIWYEKGPYPGF